MYLGTLAQVTFFGLLHRIDQDLAEGTRAGRCPFCCGPLHLAAYERKPRGGPEGIAEAVCLRLSLCCGRRGCRRRTLPPSCLFLGRKVYWGAVVLVVVALRQRRPESFSAGRLRALFGVSWETVRRWMGLFAAVFPSSEMWRRVRGLVPVAVRDDELPAALLEAFVEARGDERAGMIGCLELLARGEARRGSRGRMRSTQKMPRWQ